MPSSLACIKSDYFYPRPPRGGRRLSLPDLFRVVCISIHALREEGDRDQNLDDPVPENFYPRPPRGGRHALAQVGAVCAEISIHALREEGD